MTVEEALRLARQIHGEQVDDLGEDYVDGHLSRVARAVSGYNDPVLSVAAALHGSLEGRKTKAEKLFASGVPLEAVRVIGIVTKRYNEHDDAGYEAFISRIIESGNEGAVRLKLADVEDHMRGLAGTPEPEAAHALVPRYERARGRLARAVTEMG